MNSELAMDGGFFTLADGRLRPVWRFVIAAVLVVLANLAGGLLGFGVAFGHPLIADMLYRLFSTVLLFVGFAFMLRHFDHAQGSPLANMGLPLGRRAGKDFVIGAALGFGMIALAVLAIAAFGDLEFRTVLNASTLRRGMAVIVLLLAGALLEELMFRGYPFQRLVESTGATGAILVFSVLFGAAHLGNPNAGGILSWGMFNTIAVGVLFAIAYLRFGSLWLPWGLHFAWNFSLGVLFGLPVSGLRDFSFIVRTQASGPKLLTGGGYGIEASLTGAVVILIGLGVIMAMPQRAPAQLAEPAAAPLVAEAGEFSSDTWRPGI
ncbi:MAG TPA: type II CAAX endopeptidase family protein [Clostridia bacterium]|nr:type II CAAX endopeptidase family protein [Clostridia bacterium]